VASGGFDVTLTEGELGDISDTVEDEPTWPGGLVLATVLTLSECG